MRSKLTDMQKAFCREYLVDLNATQAAIRAGYCAHNPKYVDRMAYQLMRSRSISAEIQQLMDKRAKKVELKAEDILYELLMIAKVDLAEAYDESGHLKPIHQIPEETRRAIAGIKVYDEFVGKGRDREKIGETVEVKFWDKTKALEALGRHLKLFTDKFEHTGKDGGPIDLRNVTDQELDARILELTGKIQPKEIA